MVDPYVFFESEKVDKRRYTSTLGIQVITDRDIRSLAKNTGAQPLKAFLGFARMSGGSHLNQPFVYVIPGKVDETPTFKVEETPTCLESTFGAGAWKFLNQQELDSMYGIPSEEAVLRALQSGVDLLIDPRVIDEQKVVFAGFDASIICPNRGAFHFYLTGEHQP